MTTSMRRALKIAVALVLGAGILHAQPAGTRTISGVVLTEKNEGVPGATVAVHLVDAIRAGPEASEQKVLTDQQGQFTLVAPTGALQLRVSGNYIPLVEKILAANDAGEHLELHIHYAIPARHESIVIRATAFDPTIDRRNDSVYKKTLFSRDDQLFDTLASGINTGQHEGGGKSLEIRRFGFNLDHGGVNGGLKVLVDDVQQNQSTQGHGQGYLGALKTLTPELVEGVDILNGPFSAEYGDFSGLGVAHIRLKESLPDQLTVRIQGGSFDAYRGFLGYSPALENADAFLAYEGSHSDGPFLNPARYGRNNVTGNYTRHLNDKESLGFKFNFGTNDFYSSGQLPLDQEGSGRLDRFGFVDPYDGGRVRLGTLGAYYKRDLTNGDILRLDGFLGRSLFDLYSNFTFFLRDPIHGDEIQQHDSRFQQGVNAQYLHPYRLFGQSALLTAGSNFHDNQINVGLLHTEARRVLDVATSANAHVSNAAGYVQQGIDFLAGRLHMDAGLRFDYFRFDVDDHLDPTHSGVQGASRFQPKANLSYTPASSLPLTLYASYGRGISSQDARGVVQRPKAPKLATTDFYQLGTSHRLRRLSLSTDVFLIDRSNEQVYIPDDGTFELKGPSRSYGWEAKTSAEMTKYLALNGGFTQVSNAFYRGTFPRDYVDSAPHSTANSGLTITAWRGFNGSLRYRHISSYRLNGFDPSIRATGLDVIDLSMSRRIRRGVELNFAVDNLNNKRYYETQKSFPSRLQNEPPEGFTRVHATPGSPVGFTVGLSFRLREK
jgi:outer membrane receptor protein involved in Fe transport